jgi:outer membrane protein
MVTDFGRTASLVGTAKARAAAQGRYVVNTRAQVLLEVSQAYYQALAADSVLKAAQAAVDNRSLTLRQVRALAASLLKSTLDVSFAEVALSEVELQLYRAENDVQSGRARLAAALGFEASVPFTLTDAALPPPLVSEPDGLIAQAMKDRPDLAGLTFNRDAAYRFADAEKRLGYPSISALGAAGVLPVHDDRLRGTYSSAGVNLNIPILNGGLFAARRTEAELRAKAASSDVQDLAVQIARDVRFAWLEANTAFRRLDVTARLVAETAQALRLAKLRYDNGLGSIVELNQAQFSQTSAEIEAASAKYEYLSRRSALDYAIGALP